MPNALSLQEVCTLLDIDLNTLKRWMQRAEIEPVIDTVDLRRRTITLDEVYHLATQHNRAVTLASSVSTPAHKPDKSTELLKRIEALEKQVAAIEDILHPAARLPEPPVPKPAKKKKVMQEVTRVAQEKPVKKWLPPLPDGLVVAASYAERHGVAVSTVKGAIERGELVAIAGEWKVGRAHVTLALSKEGQTAFHAMYRDRDSFQVQQDCFECLARDEQG
jgi:hypothetical protein